MTTPTNSDNEPEPMTFAELRAALETAAPVYDSFLGKTMDPDHVRFHRIRELCERRSDLFAEALDLSLIEPLGYFELLRMVNEGVDCGAISDSTAVDLMAGSARFRGCRHYDGSVVYVRVEADFTICKAHVKRALSQADAMNALLRRFGPLEMTGIAVPVLAGHQLYKDSYGMAEPLYGTTFIQL